MLSQLFSITLYIWGEGEKRKKGGDVCLVAGEKRRRRRVLCTFRVPQGGRKKKKMKKRGTSVSFVTRTQRAVEKRKVRRACAPSGRSTRENREKGKKRGRAQLTISHRKCDSVVKREEKTRGSLLIQERPPSQRPGGGGDREGGKGGGEATSSYRILPTAACKDDVLVPHRPSRCRGERKKEGKRREKTKSHP